NAQRKAVYRKRKNALFGDRLDLDIANMFFDTIEEVVVKYNGRDDYRNLEEELIRVLGVQPPFDEEKFGKMSQLDAINDIYNMIIDNYEAKNKKLEELIYENVKPHYKQIENRKRHIRVPFTDGQKALEVSTSIEDAHDSQGKSIMQQFERSIV